MQSTPSQHEAVLDRLGVWFQVLFISLRGTFHLFLTVLVHYRSVVSLAGGPRGFDPVSRVRSTQVPNRESSFALRALLYGRILPVRFGYRAFCTSRLILWDNHVGPITPNTQRAHRLSLRAGLGYFPFLLAQTVAPLPPPMPAHLPCPPTSSACPPHVLHVPPAFRLCAKTSAIRP